ncbi:MAG: formimidoylglutamate deiminase [Roseitalea sp.]|jgi:formimidoylglutamate deiminase|nr:formimidoylglutamate deiminase [Roseitalea sp.]MBO6722401.1 formimidoylglutamate deiminase [Roseitalea sp.]MBO6741985.1 formimidoylglutamate deiminase [Roseitalea sp.]
MTALWAPEALLPDGWARNVRVTIENGKIASVAAGTETARGDHRLTGRALLPAMANLHSHTFQRAMAGMTERRGDTDDSFWTWRDLMYRFVGTLEPDEIGAIAALAFIEMLEAGYGSVAEFHYLHHQPDGTAYDNRAELSHRVIGAAAETGIGLTFLPVLYTYAGTGGQALSGGQRRFGNHTERLLRIAEAARPELAEDGGLGAAPHSLRAVSLDQIAELQAAFPGGPLHIHAAEQTAEVDAIVAAHGARPVELLLDRVGIDERWCIVHATHMTADETRRLAQSGAVAGLCPITEANLGDGLFNAAEFLDADGAFGVGTDSNVEITLAGELRLFEYGQRLHHRARNVMSDRDASTGETLHRAALAGGARALGRDCGAIVPGMHADLLALHRDHETLAPLATGQLLDGFVFAGGANAITDVWSAGRHMVRNGRHIARDDVTNRYGAAMKRIVDRL